MNEDELQRSHPLYQTNAHAPFVATVPSAEPDASWNLVTHLIESEITCQLVTLSTLVDISDLSYTTALHCVHRMINAGIIVQRTRTGVGAWTGLLA